MATVQDRRVPARLARPAPGVREGDCWTGCGRRRAKENGYFCSRGCRTTCAPDGRLITEAKTKWCQTCQRRLPRESFPIRLTRQKSGYVEKIRYYCLECEVMVLRQIHTRPDTRERNRLRAKELYHSSPHYRQRKLDRGREYREELKQDPARWELVRLQKKQAYHRMMERRKAAQKEQVKLDQDPLVLGPDDPMRGWLFEQLEFYARERNLTVLKVMPELGHNWQRWKPSMGTHGGRYMPMVLVDKILTRLDLSHRLQDFHFQRRSELRYG